MSRRRLPAILVSALSGLVWGATVLIVLGPDARATLGTGVVFAPVIGIAIGLVSIRFKDAPALPMAAISLTSLYLAAMSFGLGTALMLGNGREFWVTTVLFPWAMTVGGFVCWMWPLAYLNHRVVARFA